MRVGMMIPATILLLASAASAQTVPDWSHAKRVEIDLTNFRFTPATITLQHGQPYVLHLTNKASGGHDFVAERFFAAAKVAPQDRASVAKGEIDLKGGQSIDVHLIAPEPGSYDVHCSHFMHATFGMKGKLVVS